MAPSSYYWTISFMYVVIPEPASVGMKEKKNASAFFDISNIAKGGVREEKNASAFFDIPDIAKGKVGEEGKPETGSVAIQSPAFSLPSLRSGFQETSPVPLFTGF